MDTDISGNDPPIGYFSCFTWWYTKMMYRVSFLCFVRCSSHKAEEIINLNILLANVSQRAADSSPISLSTELIASPEMVDDNFVNQF